MLPYNGAKKKPLSVPALKGLHDQAQEGCALVLLWFARPMNARHCTAYRLLGPQVRAFTPAALRVFGFGRRGNGGGVLGRAFPTLYDDPNQSPPMF